VHLVYRAVLLCSEGSSELSWAAGNAPCAGTSVRRAFSAKIVLGAGDEEAKRRRQGL